MRRIGVCSFFECLLKAAHEATHSQNSVCWEVFFFLRFYLFIFRWRGRETTMCQRNIDWLPLIHPQLGTGLQPRPMPLTGIKSFSLWEDAHPLCHTSQGCLCELFFFLSNTTLFTKNRQCIVSDSRASLSTML